MAAQIIDGKELSGSLKEKLKERINLLSQKGCIPGLAVVLVGEDPASISYVTAKDKACAALGIYSRAIRLPENVEQKELLELIDELNNDKKIDGILVQLPLPKHLDEDLVINSISPEKDVDGFHPINFGKLVLGKEGFIPCTPYGILEMLKSKNIETSGAHIVIVGRSNIVGKPLANLFIRKGAGANATVTVCHTGTKDLAEHCRRADIVVAAVGRPNTIDATMIKEGAVVIDVGVNRVVDNTKKRGYRLVGDVDFDSVKEKASFITPVPGGVGPMTITMLLHNTVWSAENRGKIV